MPHDFKTRPELHNSQIEFYYFQSPHKQIMQSFTCRCTKVHDGDTITVAHPERDFPTKVRFFGIDTKELSEGGQEAEEWLRARLEGQEIYIQLADERVGKWGRILGTIFHGGMNVNEELIQNGLALPFDRKNEGKIINMVKSIESVIEWP